MRNVVATRSDGVEVALLGTPIDECLVAARAWGAETGAVLIHPFDHPDIVAGQGTAAMELIEETGALDYLLVPCGGGGLISGCAIAANHLSPGIKVIGVEPAAGDDVTRSFATGVLQSVHNPATIADGSRPSSSGIGRAHV